MVMMVLPLNHTLRIKQRRVPKDIIVDEPGKNKQRSKKCRGENWMPHRI